MDMDKQTVTDVMQKTRELMDAPTCSREAGEAARRWLDINRPSESTQVPSAVPPVRHAVHPAN